VFPSGGAGTGAGAAAAVRLSDAQLLRLGRLALLRTGEPGSREAARLQADVSGILNFLHILRAREEAGQGAAGSATAAAAAAAADPSSSSPSSSPSSSSSSSREALAVARLEELRPDVVTEGGDAEKILRHAAVREGPYFSVPRVVEE
jgi:Asp-tRNA(Asn)/Glu-tRNA(Gln) amidotransferase C subunit